MYGYGCEKPVITFKYLHWVFCCGPLGIMFITNGDSPWDWKTNTFDFYYQGVYE